jgi:uncharacterized protein
MPAYRERAADRLIQDLLNELPALLLVGPRATGKTTTAMKHVATTIRLDSPGDAVAFRADPDSALRGLKEPVLLDEWQAVPEVLGAVKRAVDADPHPGRFLLTGSVRADLAAETWPGTGRLVRVPLFGMTVAEQIGRRTKPLLDRLARGEDLVVPPHAPDLRGYVELALKSGFPEAALGLSERARAHWIESYLDQLLTRDAPGVGGMRDPAKLRRYFEAYALSSAGLVDDKTLFETAGLNRKTALAYEQLLLNLMVVDRTSPWRTNRLKRLVRSPKRYLTDAALLAASLRVDANGILREGDLLGRLLDTFVASQLRAELPVAECRPRLYHLRQEQGRHEVDLIAEVSATRVIAIEVKASSAPAPDSAQHLVWLRDQLGNRFVRGLVLHTGRRAYEIDKDILAAPIATLWA